MKYSVFKKSRKFVKREMSIFAPLGVFLKATHQRWKLIIHQQRVEETD